MEGKQYGYVRVSKARGVNLGRRPKEKPENYLTVYELWHSGEVSARGAASQLGVNHKTFLKRAHEQPA